MTFKTVWQFVESNGSQFQEIWYKEGTNISTVVDPGGQSVNQRLKFLHPLNTFVRVRVSQVGALRNTLNVLINRAGKSPGVQGPLPTGAALVCQVAGVNGGSRKWWMRGNAKDDYARDPTTGVDKPSDPFKLALGDMFTDLAAEGYGILRQTPLINPNIQLVKVTNADGKTIPGQTTLSCQTPAGVVQGSQIVLSRFSPKDLPRLNGRWTVLAATNATVTIPYVTPANAIVVPLTGQLKALQFDQTHVVDPTRSGFDHMGTRTSRSPITGSRGAKRAQRIRSLA